MEILLLCPSGVATGGTESIHRLCAALNELNHASKILYIGGNLDNPQPERYKDYKCDFITSLPKEYSGAIIFPEIWANWVLCPEYKNCIPIVNWQGVDVYFWNTPAADQGKYLHRPGVIHMTNCDYGMAFLKGQKLTPIKVCDRLEDEFFENYSKNTPRKDVILYNPTKIKQTPFQQAVISRCVTELGMKFLALEGFSKPELIQLYRQHKLYIDFGLFSGRERLPREAVLGGCCILTSNSGAAKYYEDNPIPDYYKVDIHSNPTMAMTKILDILKNYAERCVDFDEYRRRLVQDRDNYESDVRRLYDAILDYHSGV